MRKDTRVWTRIEGIQYYLWSFFWGCAPLSCKLSIISRFPFPLKQLKAICLGSRLWVRFKFWSRSGTQIEKSALPDACSFYGRGQNIRKRLKLTSRAHLKPLINMVYVTCTCSPWMKKVPQPTLKGIGKYIPL